MNVRHLYQPVTLKVGQFCYLIHSNSDLKRTIDYDTRLPALQLICLPEPVQLAEVSAHIFSSLV